MFVFSLNAQYYVAESKADNLTFGFNCQLQTFHLHKSFHLM